MTTKSTLTSAIAAIAMIAGAAQAHAEADFSTLGGIPAEPMNTAEMDAVQGKAFWMDGGSIVDNHTFLGFLHYYTDSTGYHHAYSLTTGAWSVLIGNQWFASTPLGGPIVTVGSPSLIYPPGTENIANPWLYSNVYWNW